MIVRLSTSVKSFVDTNILVYAYDRGAGRKHTLAQSTIEKLWQDNSGVLSTQVLQEFYVNVRRKALRPISIASARSLIADYMVWDPVVNDGTSILEAMDAERRYKISFWDALIVVAAQRCGANVILSEDFSHERRFGSAQVLDPFITD
jgi:predicted nucleic acid-binding protein